MEEDNKTVSATVGSIKEAYKKGSSGEKTLLERLYPNLQLKPRDFTSLKTFDDVCKELGYSTEFKYEAGTAYKKIVEAINKLDPTPESTSVSFLYLSSKKVLYYASGIKFVPLKYTFKSSGGANHATLYFGKEFENWINS